MRGGVRSFERSLSPCFGIGSDADGPFLETPRHGSRLRATSPASSGGQRSGRSVLVGALGVGGMGEVWRAAIASSGREVAIKICCRRCSRGIPRRRARFAREARLLATLNHPSIGAIYGLEEMGGETALVLELVEGGRRSREHLGAGR